MVATEAGYTGGTTTNPTYGQVCSGATGHAEAVKVFFDKNKVSYQSLVFMFLSNHKVFLLPPLMRNDGQYMTAVFAETEAERGEAEKAVASFESSHRVKTNVPVKLTSRFWRAEDYHQHYYKQNSGGFCGTRS